MKRRRTIRTRINPVKKRIGAYWGQVETLIELGANQYHSLQAVRDRMQQTFIRERYIGSLPDRAR